MRKINFNLGFLLSLLSINCFAAKVGDNVSYILSKDYDRSSWFIENGKAILTVEDMNAGENKNDLILAISYSFEVTLYKTISGSINIPVPLSMFNEDFTEDLKKNGTLIQEGFKIDYLGTTSAEDFNGNFYDQCTAMRIYDIKDSGFDDLKFEIRVHPSIPLLGAVELNISGEVEGFEFIAGLDLLGFDN